MKGESGTRLVVDVVSTCVFNKRRFSRRENMHMIETEDVVTAIEKPLRFRSIHLIDTSRRMFLPRFKSHSKKFAAMNDCSLVKGENYSFEENVVNICCGVETLHVMGETPVEYSILKTHESFGNVKEQVREVEKKSRRQYKYRRS